MILDWHYYAWAALEARYDTLDVANKYKPSETFAKPVSGGLPAPFVVADDGRFESVRNAVTKNCPNEQSGMLLITVYAPLSYTYSQQLGILGTVVEHFPQGLSMSANGVKLVVDSTPSMGPIMREDGYNRIPVMIYWRSQG